MRLSNTRSFIRKESAMVPDFTPKSRYGTFNDLFGDRRSEYPEYFGDQSKPANWTDDQTAANAAYEFYASSGENPFHILPRLRGDKYVEPTANMRSDTYVSPEELVSTARTAAKGAPALAAAMASRDGTTSSSERMRKVLYDPQHAQTLRALYRLRATEQGRRFSDTQLDYQNKRLAAKLEAEGYTPEQINKQLYIQSNKPQLDLIDSAVALGKSLKQNGTIDEQYQAARDTMLGDIASAERMQGPVSGITEADVARMSALSNNPYRLAAIARARHAQALSNNTQSAGEVPSYEKLLADTGEKTKLAPFYWKNKNTIGDLQELGGESFLGKIWWILKTLFSDPGRFYRVVNALNQSSKGGDWGKLLGNRASQFQDWTPWLNTINNVAGTFNRTKDYQAW